MHAHLFVPRLSHSEKKTFFDSLIFLQKRQLLNRTENGRALGSMQYVSMLLTLTTGSTGNSDDVDVSNCDLICSHVLTSAIDQSVLLFS